jgi:hypothetical protein
MMYFAAFHPILDMPISAELKNTLISEIVRELTAIHIGQCTDIMWNKGTTLPNEQ